MEGGACEGCESILSMGLVSFRVIIECSEDFDCIKCLEYKWV